MPWWCWLVVLLVIALLAAGVLRRMDG